LELQAIATPPNEGRLGVAASSSLSSKEWLMSKFVGLLTVLLFSVLPAIAANPLILMDTSAGPIKIELFDKEAPTTVKNFLQYVEDKHYDGTIFHRVIDNFMIQGGGMEPGMKEKKTREPIKNESGNNLSNKRGTLAMARTSEPDSATAQFFVNVVDNDFLDKAKARDKVGYCVFGRVVEGMDIVDKIRKVKTGSKGAYKDVPLEDIVIKSVRVVK
jgi:cyclophilin family peptidyl-prolyl cis-trans isomerase